MPIVGSINNTSLKNTSSTSGSSNGSAAQRWAEARQAGYDLAGSNKYAQTGNAVPYVPQSNTTDRVWETKGTGSSSSSSSNTAYYNQLINQYQNSLNNIASSLDELNKGSQNQRDTNLNELQSSFNKNKRSYDTNSQQNIQNNQLTKNKIADQASQGLRGLLRTLGANGAGGSSAAAYLAPNAVTDTANAELADANSTFAQNQQNLDTNWNDYLNDYDNDKKKIEDAYQSALRSNEQNVLNQRNNILNQLISAYAGAGRSGDMANATRQINENTNRINELNRFAKPTYNGTTATYTPADLASYNTGNTNVRTSLSGATNATNNPTLAMLLGVRRRNGNEG